jgi:hypothetical protein
MAHLSKPELWAKIEAYEFPDLQDGTSFEDYLVKKTRMSARTTKLAVLEYRRFTYLSATSSDKVVPSDTVAEVWKAHIGHSTEYRDHFCATILDQELPYMPIQERFRNKSSYSTALALYRAEFGNPSPRKIWPRKFDHLICATAGASSIGLFYFVAAVDNRFVLGLAVTVPLVLFFGGPFRSDD